MQPLFHLADELERERLVPSFPPPVAAQIATRHGWYSDNWVPSHEAIRHQHPRNLVAAILSGGSKEWDVPH
jgi:hypothetical protein